MKKDSWHRFTVTELTLKEGAWRKKKETTGLTLKERTELVAKLQTPCTHEGACLLPFKNCDGGATVSVELEEKESE